jgi:hypothetical protein
MKDPGNPDFSDLENLGDLRGDPLGPVHQVAAGNAFSPGPRMIPCSRCKGTGNHPCGRCFKCQGSGKMLAPKRGMRID